MSKRTAYITIKCMHVCTFNGPFSRSTRVSRYQKGKTNLDFTGARDSEWQWHQLGHMQVCTSLQTDNHASNPLPTTIKLTVQLTTRTNNDVSLIMRAKLYSRGEARVSCLGGFSPGYSERGSASL